MFNFDRIIPRIMGIGEIQRQSIISFVTQILVQGVGFFSTIYFAHTLGAGVLGAYFLFMSYFGIISMVTDGGFGGAAIKRISEGIEQNEYLSAFFAVRSLFVVLAVLALILFRSYFVDINVSGVFIWLLLALIVSIVSGTISYGVAGCGKMGIFSTCRFIGEISRILLQIVAVYFGFGIAGIAGGLVAGLLIAAIIEWRFLDLHLVRFRWSHLKSLSTFSFWLFLTSGGVMLYSYSDTIMIGYFLSNADVGIYRVIFQFSGAAMFIANSLNAILWPKVSRWGKEGEIGLIEKSLSRAFSYSLVLAVPILAGGLLLGDRLLYFFYGADFARGFGTLVLLLVVQIISVFQMFLLMYLSALDRQKYAFKVTAVASIANILLNFILIPVIGIAGAAFATLITMTLNAVLGHRLLSKMIKVKLENNTILNILKASSIMSVFIICYRLVIPLSSVWLTTLPVFFGGIIYVIMVLKLDRKIYDELKGIVM